MNQSNKFHDFHAELPYKGIFQNVKNTSFMHTSDEVTMSPNFYELHSQKDVRWVGFEDGKIGWSKFVYLHICIVIYQKLSNNNIPMQNHKIGVIDIS